MKYRRRRGRLAHRRRSTAALAKAELRDDLESVKRKRLELATLNATMKLLQHQAGELRKGISRATAGARRWRDQIRKAAS
jgi:hypothetical protein